MQVMNASDVRILGLRSSARLRLSLLRGRCDPSQRPSGVRFTRQARLATLGAAAPPYAMLSLGAKVVLLVIIKLIVIKLHFNAAAGVARGCIRAAHSSRALSTSAVRGTLGVREGGSGGSCRRGAQGGNATRLRAVRPVVGSCGALAQVSPPTTAHRWS